MIVSVHLNFKPFHVGLFVCRIVVIACRLEATLCPYLIPARHANLIKHLLCVTNDSFDDLIKKCDDGNLSPILEKEISKLNK